MALRQRVLGADHQDTLLDQNSLALDRLIALYTALEKPEEVKKWQAEKAKLN